MNKIPTRNIARAWLRDHPGPHYIGELAQALDRTNEQVSSACTADANSANPVIKKCEGFPDGWYEWIGPVSWTPRSSKKSTTKKFGIRSPKETLERIKHHLDTDGIRYKVYPSGGVFVLVLEVTEDD